MLAFGSTKICKSKQLAPKYFSFKLNENNRQNRNTKIAATGYRINQEIKIFVL